MYVCMYVYMYVCVHVCMCTCMYACELIHMHTYVYKKSTWCSNFGKVALHPALKSCVKCDRTNTVRHVEENNGYRAT